MRVIASGQAGLFATQTSTGFLVERIDTGHVERVDARDIRYCFAGCNDLTFLTACDEADARAAAESAWSVDRAVRLFAMLLDPSETPEDLIEVGEALEELLVSDGVIPKVEAQLFIAPLPQPIDINAVSSAINSSPLSKSLLQRFLALQTTITRVRGTFDAIDEDAFDGRRNKETFLEKAIDRGCVRALVISASSAKGVEGALFELYDKLKDLDNSRVIIQRWTQSFARTEYDLIPLMEPDEQINIEPKSDNIGGRMAFERAIQQQIAIVERIRDADFETARRYARELVDGQRRTGTAEHIAKSLTKLSQSAKKLEAIELALEWALAAVETKGDDPMTHAQLADLLMRVGRYTEAERSLNLAQSFGEEGFAVTGRARMLRYQGHFEAALTAYRDALARYEFGDSRTQFDLAGVAECLRDLDRLDEALDAYEEALRQCPYVAALHSGRASTLAELGRFDEAFDGYRAALRLEGDDVVPRNGIATLFRRAGDFDRAEADFRQVISEFPFDAHARGGLVATLREMGRYREAVLEAEALVKHLPASPDSLWTLADAQIDARQFDDASRTLRLAIEDFRHSAGLRAGLARVEKAKGNYKAALALYDDAARDFPSNSWLQINRADMLRRLGNTDEALRIYTHALQRYPRRLALKNAVASILIHQRRYSDAREHLYVDDPRTSDEWRNFALHGMLDAASDLENQARDRFQWGIDKCLFRRERQLLRAALSRLQLKGGELDLALHTAEECSDDVTELIKFHVTAVQVDKRPATVLYDRLVRGPLPEPYHELRDEIAAHFNVVALKPKHSAAWLLEREADVLLLEAA